MWLIHVETRQLEEFIGLEVPHYAILSHTWVTGQEVTFQELRNSSGLKSTATTKNGWQKIDRTCRQAARDGLEYAWVDTCCIDKSSSAELSEAINSMFRWYKRATVCYVFLPDLNGFSVSEVEGEGLQASIEHCRWFTRSWTLQELIAPMHVNFYNQDWEFCFTKETASRVLARITGIDVDILNHKKDLSAASVAQKMSWAGTRRATRIEDEAYSLLGIFGINMPMLYGEEERAFLRLQAEIISSCPDPTILAWMLRSETSENISKGPEDSYTGVMASSPVAFRDCAEVKSLSDQSLFDFTMSNRGMRLRAQFGLLPLGKAKGSCLVLPLCRIRDNEVYGIRLRNIGGGRFVRQNAYGLVHIRPRQVAHRLMLDPFLLPQLPPPSTTAKPTQGLILRHRHCVLEVAMPLGMEVYRRWPWQNWDEQDSLFFGPSRPPEDVGWASLKFVASAPRPFSDASGSIDFLFYVFDWARQPGSGATPRWTIHRVRGAVDDRAIEQMNHEAVNDSWNAYWVANRLVSNGVPEQHSLVAGTSGKDALLLVSTIRSVEDAEKCVNPLWRVEFSWNVVPRHQVSKASNRGWKEINWGPIWRPPWDVNGDSS
ncbi:hypothetical protein VMCG_09862 [Cytospora schulzeri]|uniref:Heterokaryon incompatibility domain-containing protein n=1 Tax=Cytospora schulzeri TaxID=448051 RepID=A0A423VDS4_9PEZI|nr:hypothetical protein VMCG_09862 [Valsa malicola]